MNTVIKALCVVLLCGVLTAAVDCRAAADPDGPGQTDRAADGAETKPSRLKKFYGFGPMEILKLEWKAGLPIVADVNGDGLNDLVVTNNPKARIDLLLQRSNFRPGEDIAVDILDEDVNDLFGRERTWRFKRFSYDLDVAATSLVVADLNGDGLDDLAFHAKDALRVALQEKPPAGPAAPGEGPRLPAWLPARKIDIRGGLSVSGALAAGDLNGDARTDLALLAGDGLFVLLQEADGALARPVKYHGGGGRPKRLYVADVDGDRRKDLVVLTGDKEFPVRVRYQSDRGRLGPELRYRLPDPRALELVRLSEATRNCFASVSQQSGRVRLSALTAEGEQAGFPVLAYPLPVTESADKRDIVAGDVDGDGLVDVVASDPGKAEFLLFRADAKAGLLAPKRFPGLSDMRRLAAGDLDGDGRDEIVALSVKEKIIAVSRLTGGRLSFPESVTVVGQPQAMELADVNGDGRSDLVYVSKELAKKDTYTLRTVFAVGRDDATPGPELVLKQLSDAPMDLRIADVDGDDRVDVMVLRPFGAGLLLVRQSGPGEFTEVTGANVHAGLVANVHPATLSLAPLGPKGSTAVLLTKKDFARAVVFDAQTGWRVVDQYGAPNERSSLAGAVACRLGAGPTPAIVTYDTAGGKLGILTRQADGTYQTEREVIVGAVSVRKILYGNFGGHSPMSILVCGAKKLVLVPVAGRRHVLRKLASFAPTIKGMRYGALAVADVNDDGLVEVVLCDQGRHHVEILSFDAAGQLVSASRFKVFEQPRREAQSSYGQGSGHEAGQPRAVRLADVTGDGKTDLILRVHDRIVVYPQD